MQGLSRGAPISILWLDTYATVEWISDSEVDVMVPTLVETRGFFVSEDEECIRIAGSKQINNQLELSSIDVIPKGMIKEIKTDANINT